MSSKDLPKDKLEPENPFRLLYSDYGKSTDHIDQSDTTSTSLRRSAQIRLRDSGLSDESIRAGDSLRVSAFPNVPEKEPKTSGQNLPDNNSALLGDANYSAKGIPVPYQPPDIPNNRIVFSAPIDRVELPDHPRLDARLPEQQIPGTNNDSGKIYSEKGIPFPYVPPEFHQPQIVTSSPISRVDIPELLRSEPKPDQPKITTEFLDDRTATGTKGIPIPYVPPDNPPTRIVMSVPISRADLPELSSTSPILKIEIPEFRNGNTKPVNGPITEQKPGNDQKPIIGQQPSNDQRPVISQQPINDQRPVVSQLPVSDLRSITGLKPPTDLNQIADPKPTVDNGNSRIIAGNPVTSVDIASGTSAKGIPFPYIPPEVPSTRIVTSAPIGKIDSPERIVSNIPIGKIDSPERIVTNTPIGRTDSPERIVSNIPIGKIDSSAPVTGRTSDQKPIFDSGNSRIVANTPVTNSDIARDTSSAKGIPFPYVPPENPSTRIVTSVPVGRIDSPELRTNLQIARVDIPESRLTFPIVRFGVTDSPATTSPIARVGIPDSLANTPIARFDLPISRPIIKSDTNSDLGKPSSKGFPVPYVPPENPLTRIVTSAPIGRVDSPSLPISRVTIPDSHAPESHTIAPITRTNAPNAKIDLPTFRAGDSTLRVQLKFDVEPRPTKANSDVLGPRFVPTYTPEKFGFPLQAKSVSEYLGPRFLPVTVIGRADNQTPAFKATPEVISTRNILSTKSLFDVVPARILPTAKPIPEANPARVVATSKSTAEVIPSHIIKTSKSAPEAVPPHVIPTTKLTPEVVTARTSLPSKSALEITAARTAPTPKSTHEAIPARIIATSKSAPEVIPTRTAVTSKPSPEPTPSRIAATTKSTPEVTPSRIASTTKPTPEVTSSRIASTTKPTPEVTPPRIAATNKSTREIIPSHIALPPAFSKLPFKAAVAAGFKTSEKTFVPKTPILNAALTAWKEEEKQLAEKPKVHLEPAESEVFQLEKPVSEGSDEDKSEFPEDGLLAGALLLGSAAKAKNNSKSSSEEDSNGNENTSACQPLIRPTHLISSQDCLANIAESKYGDRAIAFLIIELNAGSLKQTDLGDRLVIELSERQQIELPVSSDIENFYNRNAKNSKTIVTIVNQSNVTKELLDTYFGAFVS